MRNPKLSLYRDNYGVDGNAAIKNQSLQSPQSPRFEVPDLTNINKNNNINNSKIVNELIDAYMPNFSDRSSFFTIANKLKEVLKAVDYQRGYENDIETIITAYIEIMDRIHRYDSSSRKSEVNIDDILEELKWKVQGQLNNPEIYEVMWPERDLPKNYRQMPEYKRQEKVTYCKELLEYILPVSERNANDTVFTDDDEIDKRLDEIDTERMKKVLNAIKNEGIKIFTQIPSIPYKDEWMVKKYYLTHQMIVELFNQLPRKYKTNQTLHQKKTNPKNPYRVSLLETDPHFGIKPPSKIHPEPVEGNTRTPLKFDKDKIVSEIQQMLENANVNVQDEYILNIISTYESILNKLPEEDYKRVIVLYIKYIETCVELFELKYQDMNKEDRDIIIKKIRAIEPEKWKKEEKPEEYINRLVQEYIETKNKNMPQRKQVRPELKHRTNRSSEYKYILEEGRLIIIKEVWSYNEQTQKWKKNTQKIKKMYNNVSEAEINGDEIKITFNTKNTIIYKLSELTRETGER